MLHASFLNVTIVGAFVDRRTCLQIDEKNSLVEIRLDLGTSNELSECLFTGFLVRCDD